VIELPAGATIALTEPDNGSNGLPVVERSVTIAGRGARVVRDEALECPGSPELRLFDVADGGILALEDLTIANGCLAAEPGGGIRSSGGSVMLGRTLVEGNEAWAGGGGLAVNGGNLALLDSTIRANLSGGPGGGISVTGSPGLVRIDRSTLAGNLAASGGGLALDGTARAWVRNTTLSGNAATAGGGMALAGEAPAVVLEFSTVTENAAASGAGIALDAGSLALHGSLVGDNAAGADCAATVGVASASGLSLDTDGSCAALVGSGVTTVASFALGPLGENGGWTETHLPLATSPALDAAPACAMRSAAPLFDDQRTMPRPSDDDGDGNADCELGAVERGPVFVDGFESGDASRWSLATP
jgi:hypothetical protein